MKKVSICLFLLFSMLFCLEANAAANAEKEIFSVGKEDGNSNEFVDFNKGTDSYKLPLSSVSFPKGMKASINPKINLTYDLDTIPENGLLFRFKTTDADMSTPQLVIYSNNTMAGIVQITGTNGSGGAYPFKETYEVYIPKSLLKNGNNTLRLEAYGGIYMTNTSGNARVWWTWDYIQLIAPSQLVSEPLNGRNVDLGSAIFQGFGYNQNTIKLLPELSEWLGTAYSGNFTRVGLYSDTKSAWEKTAKPYLETLKDINVEPLVLFFGTEQFNSADMQQGKLPDSVKNHYSSMIKEYGSLFQYLELDNEPGLFNHNQESLVKLATFINEQTPTTKPNLKLVAPGWAYWASNGTPYGWERNPLYRKQIEDLTVATNGHSYGTSGTTQGRGGSLNENLLTFDGNITKDFFMSEVGANDSHMDSNKLGVDNYRFASVFDRELRGDIGSADHIIQHAAFYPSNPSYSLFSEPSDWNTAKINEIKAWASNSNELGETRLKTFRRLSAAYATHGSPLDYEIINQDEINNKKIYIRAVDTSSLGKSEIGASSNKLILSLVNFETVNSEPVTVRVKVKMPTEGNYIGERYDAQEVYGEAHKSLGSLTASPYLTFMATLKAGETTMVYLTPEENQAPTKPTSVVSQAISYDQINLSWEPSTDDVKLKGYNIYRNGSLYDFVPRSLNSYSDYDIVPNTTYNYTIQAIDESANVSVMSDSTSAISKELTITPGGPIYEAENATLLLNANLQTSKNASNGKFVGNMHCINCGIKIENITPSDGEGLYNMEVRYGSTSSSLTLYVNDEKITTMNFPTTGSATTFSEQNFNINLKEGYNTIKIVHLSTDKSGTNIDYIKLTPIETNNSNKWTSFSFNDENLLYSSKIYTDDSSFYKNADNNGDFVTFDFEGTGFRWYSNIKNDSGTADIYIDSKLVKSIDLVSAGLEGTNKIVYEVSNLSEGLHCIRIINRSDKTISFNGFDLLGKDSTIIKMSPAITDFTLDTNSDSALVGQNIQLNTTIQYDTGTSVLGNTQTEWVSDNEKVASIDDNGLVNLHEEGKATITAKVTNLTKSVTLTAIPNKTNLALNKPVYASTSLFGTLPKAIVDGKYETRWQSDYTDNEWIYIDLEKEYNLDEIKVDFMYHRAKDYEIQISNDALNWTTIETKINGSGVYDAYQFTDKHARYVKLKLTKRSSSNYVFNIQEVRIFGTEYIKPKNTTINNALGRPVVTSSVYFGASGSNVVDGNVNTRWQSAYTDFEYLYVDLGAEYSINKMDLRFLYHRASSYNIYVSNDAVNWTEIEQVRNEYDGLDEFIYENSPPSGRYVKLEFIYRVSRNYVFNLQEFEIYGDLK